MINYYQALALHPTFGNRTVNGRLLVESQSLRFESEAGNFELPLDGLQIRWGGHNKEQLLFSHPEYDAWSVYTSDQRILGNAVLNQNPRQREQIEAIAKQKKHWPLSAIVSAVALIVLIGLAGLVIARKTALVHFLANQAPVAWEVRLGGSIFAQIQSNGKLVDDARLAEQLQRAVEPLLRGISGMGYTLQFHILQDTNVNAFAIPGGHVIVHSGLLNAVDKPEELAGVLAHEIAHVTQKHGFRKVIDSAGLYLLIQSVFGDVSGLLALIADSSEFLLKQKYSRDFEREADDVGWTYLIGANIDPRGMTDFFKKLRVQDDISPSRQIDGGLNLLSTHPTTDERIQRLEAKWEKMDRKSGFLEFQRRN